MGPHVDVVGGDDYPRYRAKDGKAKLGDGKPRLLIKGRLSHVNWQPVNLLKAPGLHLLSSFQAVIGHDWREDARSFRVAEVGS